MQGSFRSLSLPRQGRLFLWGDKARFLPGYGSFDHICRTKVIFAWVRRFRSLWTFYRRSTKPVDPLLYSLWPKFLEARVLPLLLRFPSKLAQLVNWAALPILLSAFPQCSTQLLPTLVHLLILNFPPTCFPLAFSWLFSLFLFGQLLLSLPIFLQWVWFELVSGCWPSFSIILINIYSTL